jgi:hypothetical protein
MKAKLEAVMSDLKNSSTEVDRLYTLGVVNGFTEQSFPSKQCKLLDVQVLYPLHVLQKTVPMISGMNMIWKKHTRRQSSR